jgi:hypothetical protein
MQTGLNVTRRDARWDIPDAPSPRCRSLPDGHAAIARAAAIGLNDTLWTSVATGVQWTS